MFALLLVVAVQPEPAPPPRVVDPFAKWEKSIAAPELFVKDGLHMSPKGYEIWTAAVRIALR